MKWGRPCNAKGETQGNQCHYCVKVFCARFRCVGQTTIATYAKSLDDTKLKLHIGLVKKVIQCLIGKGGGDRRVTIDWEKLDDRKCKFRSPRESPSNLGDLS